MKSDGMKVKFWGVRGSIPTPGRDTLEIGGNTPCVEACAPGGEVVIFDAGTGIRDLGISLERESRNRIHIFLTHTHWDHIQGFPFFRPLFSPQATVTLYGPPDIPKGLEETLAGQMDYRYFPISFDQLSATIRFLEMPAEGVSVNGKTRVRARNFEHPGGVSAYRVEREGKAFVYATDVELGIPGELDKLVEFARGADLLIIDCQFNALEYRNGRKGWGHSTPDQVIEAARQAEVKRVALFHHDPTHTDDILLELEKQAKQKFPSLFLARDGMEVEI